MIATFVFFSGMLWRFLKAFPLEDLGFSYATMMAYNLPHAIPDGNKLELLLMAMPDPRAEQHSRQKRLQTEQRDRFENQVIRYSRFCTIQTYAILALMYVERSFLGVEIWLNGGWGLPTPSPPFVFLAKIFKVAVFALWTWCFWYLNLYVVFWRSQFSDVANRTLSRWQKGLLVDVEDNGNQYSMGTLCSEGSVQLKSKNGEDLG